MIENEEAWILLYHQTYSVAKRMERCLERVFDLGGPGKQKKKRQQNRDGKTHTTQVAEKEESGKLLHHQTSSRQNKEPVVKSQVSWQTRERKTTGTHTQLQNTTKNYGTTELRKSRQLRTLIWESWQTENESSRTTNDKKTKIAKKITELQQK
jgi:hypothetical protein